MDSAKPDQRENKPLQVIGILGGIGSGKSSVASGVRGAHVINADQIGHELLKLKEIRTRLVETFGRQILDQSGEVDRNRLAERVFGVTKDAKSNRALLEDILHPEIRAEVDRQIAKVGSQTKLILLDAALLLEAGWAERCHALVFVDTPAELRRERVSRNRNWSANELQRREASQLPIAEKRRRANFVIDNSGTLESAIGQLQRWLNLPTANASDRIQPHPPDTKQTN